MSVPYHTHDATAALVIETILAQHRQAVRAPAVRQTRRVVVADCRWNRRRRQSAWIYRARDFAFGRSRRPSHIDSDRAAAMSAVNPNQPKFCLSSVNNGDRIVIMSADTTDCYLDAMTDDEVAAQLLDACCRHAELEREMAGLLTVAQQRRFWAEQGAVSLSAWVETRTGHRREDINRLRRLGQGIRSFPALAELPIATAQLVLSCKPATDDDADLLVGLGHKLPLRDFAQAAQRWKSLRDANGTEPDAEPTRSELHLSPLLNGSYSVRGTLTGTDAKMIVAALEGEVDRALRNRRNGDPADEDLTVSQIRARGLVDLISQTMRREPSNNSVPDRYRVAIIVKVDEPIDKLALCDSTLYRAVLDAESQPLDIGRDTRSWPTPIRRAVTLRDSGCVFPGCDRPPSWCDVHHCHDWDYGGETKLDNGALLCRKHHTFLHAKHWNIAIERGRLMVRKPDGTIFQIPQEHSQAA